MNIAYAGTNVPYRLLGPHFETHVYYVNRNNHETWRYYDYDHAARGQADYAPHRKPSPLFDRAHGDADAWLSNVWRRKTDYLFLTRLSLRVVNDSWHDDRNFPIEASWAEGSPRWVHLVYENPEVQIYLMRR